MALNGQKIVDLLCGLLSPADDTDKARIVSGFQEHTKEMHFPISATLDLGVFSPNKNIVVTEVKVESASTLASGATDFWQFQLVHDDDAAGSDTAITNTFSGTTTAIAANVPASLTLATTGGVAVASGKRVAFKATKNASAANASICVRVKYKDN